MLKKSNQENNSSSSKNIKSINEIKYVDKNRQDRTFLQMSSTFANTTHISHNTISNGKCIKKIPKVINKLQKNIQTLKKYCTQISKEKPLKKIKNNNIKTQGKKKLTNSMDKPIVEINQEVEIDKLKKFYATTFGRETNNLIELYNFYKSFIENTQNELFASFSNSHNSVSINNKLESKSENSSSKIMSSQFVNSQGLKKEIEQEMDFQDKSSSRIRQQSFKQQKIDFEESKQCNSNQNKDKSKNSDVKNNTVGESINISHLLNERRESIRNKNEQENEKHNLNLPLIMRKNKVINLKIQTNTNVELNKENIEDKNKKQHKFQIFQTNNIHNKLLYDINVPTNHNKETVLAPIKEYTIKYDQKFTFANKIQQQLDKNAEKQKIVKNQNETNRSQQSIKSKFEAESNELIAAFLKKQENIIKQKKSVTIQTQRNEKQLIISREKVKENNINFNNKQTQEQTTSRIEILKQLKEIKQQQIKQIPLPQNKQMNNYKESKDKNLHMIQKELKNKNNSIHNLHSNNNSINIQNYSNLSKNNSLSTTSLMLKKQQIINQQIQKSNQPKTFIGNSIEQGVNKKFSNSQNKNLTIKSVEKQKIKEKENNQDFFEQIFKKNMFVNKIKQQINDKLKKQQKNYQEQQKYLDNNKNPSLDEAILIENNQKTQLNKNNQEFGQIVKQDLPLSKQDISLLEKLVTINNMISTNQLNLPQNRENLLVQGLRIVNKKRGFTKSKFYVDQIPKHKKNKVPQIIEIQNLSPGIMNHPITIQKDESLLGCDISLMDQRKQDSFLKNIEDIELDL